MQSMRVRELSRANSRRKQPEGDGAEGRQYEAPAKTISTEYFRHPYILQGQITGFNQTLLEQDLVEEEMLFYARDGKSNGAYRWHYFEPRTYQTGLVSERYLTDLFGRLA